jgi:hypothetical protein
VLIGDGPDRQEIEDALDRAALRDRARLVGRVDDRTLHAWYDAADLFVHPTRYEGSSIVTLEAMLHQTPIVATRVGGLPDKVIPGRTGWLAEAGDAGSLTSALREALVNRHRWQAFGRAERALLEERFDWRVIQRQYAALYQRLLSKTTIGNPDPAPCTTPCAPEPTALRPHDIRSRRSPVIHSVSTARRRPATIAVRAVDCTVASFTSFPAKSLWCSRKYASSSSSVGWTTLPKR